jgi:hypothetical protein
MKEQELIDLEFIRNDVSEEESGIDDFYYYTYNIGEFGLISNSDDGAVDGEWGVEVFDGEDIHFKNSEDLVILIDVLERNLNK